jgi:hypothetical protein
LWQNATILLGAITLGQGQQEEYSPAPTPSQSQSQNQSQSVVVNNTIIVPGQPQYYGGYGGYGGYGYGGYGRGVNDGRSFGGSQGSRPQWGSSGWEGARRTAAPGQTPGIGGNWSSAPSYGPATMK